MIKGRVWKYGDDINTDVLYAGKYTYQQLEPAEMARKALEDLDPSFAANVRPGDVIVAGRNFGCGSSREQAAACLRYAGVQAVVAKSFSRIYFRNAINLGLPVLQSEEASAELRGGDEVEIDFGGGRILSGGRVFKFFPLPESVMGIVQAGGLLEWTKKKLESPPGPAMKSLGIFNHVLGPVMRGPSSSHTAGAYHIASLARSLAGGTPRRALIAFDPEGSYARTYSQQGADRAFAMGLLGKPLTDDSFFTALADARPAGLDLAFSKRRLQRPDHPNAMEIEISRAGFPPLLLEARSVGGGEVEITRIDGFPASFSGAAYEVLAETGAAFVAAVREALAADGALIGEPEVTSAGQRLAVAARRSAPLAPGQKKKIKAFFPDGELWESAPVYFIQKGAPLFESAADLLALAAREKWSMGGAALAYEAELLGMSREEVLSETLRRYDIMSRAAERGLDPAFQGMQLLAASAGSVFRAEAEGRLADRGPQVRAAARALAVMHVNSAMGVVCAAPTGGSAGVIPGTLITLAEERGLAREKVALSLLAAGAVGLITAYRATFAAEVAGCQVEIGAAGAMAAAAVVEALDGTAGQACDAAAIAYQNTMGSVCDLVLGMVEIPCHTRNAAAAAGAFICADLILGGYANPIPLDDTIDAVYAVGRMMAPELRCTAKGGLAATPSAQALRPRGPARKK